MAAAWVLQAMVAAPRRAAAAHAVVAPLQVARAAHEPWRRAGAGAGGSAHSNMCPRSYRGAPRLVLDRAHTWSKAGLLGNTFARPFSWAGCSTASRRFQGMSTPGLVRRACRLSHALSPT